MSELDQLIQHRRSIREYTPVTPERDLLEKLILAATKAPSPSNSKPVRFVQIVTKEKKKALQVVMEQTRRELLEKREQLELSKRLNNWVNAYWRFSEFMFNAPILMAVGTVKGTIGFKGKLQNAGLIDPQTTYSNESDISVGLALQNYMLKAEELALSTCVLTAPLVFAPNPESVLGISDLDIKCFLTTGYSAHPLSEKSFEDPINIFSEI